MKKLIPVIIAVASLSLLFCFGACSKPEEKAETAVETTHEGAAVEQAEPAAEEAGEHAEAVKEGEAPAGGYGAPAHN